MDKKKKDKTRVILASLVTLLVILSAGAFALAAAGNGGIGNAILPVGIAVVIALMMIPFIKKRHFDVKNGYPYEDERTRKVMRYAMKNAYIISIYWLLAISWASEGLVEFRDTSQAIGLGIAGMAVIFGLLYWHFNRKEGLE